MPHIPSSTPLTHFKLLSFDIYGTLIDWETGIHDAFLSSPHFSNLPSSHPFKSSRESLLHAYEKEEGAVQREQPTLEYSHVLAKVYSRLVSAHDLGDGDADKLDAAAEAFGKSVGTWPPFPDTLDALHVLKKYYALVPLSNVDRASFALTNRDALSGFPFSAIYTAQDIGSYKPNPANFLYLIEHAEQDFGVTKDQILHVAQSLFHDHVPAATVGLESCWVERAGASMGSAGEKTKGSAKFEWRVRTLGELAEVVEKESDGSGK